MNSRKTRTSRYTVAQQSHEISSNVESSSDEERPIESILSFDDPDFVPHEPIEIVDPVPADVRNFQKAVPKDEKIKEGKRPTQKKNVQTVLPEKKTEARRESRPDTTDSQSSKKEHSKNQEPKNKTQVSVSAVAKQKIEEEEDSDDELEDIAFVDDYADFSQKGPSRSRDQFAADVLYTLVGEKAYDTLSRLKDDQGRTFQKIVAHLFSGSNRLPNFPANTCVKQTNLDLFEKMSVEIDCLTCPSPMSVSTVVGRFEYQGNTYGQKITTTSNGNTVVIDPLLLQAHQIVGWNFSNGVGYSKVPLAPTHFRSVPLADGEVLGRVDLTRITNHLLPEYKKRYARYDPKKLPVGNFSPTTTATLKAGERLFSVLWDRIVGHVRAIYGPVESRPAFSTDVTRSEWQTMIQETHTKSVFKLYRKPFHVKATSLPGLSRYDRYFDVVTDRMKKGWKFFYYRLENEEGPLLPPGVELYTDTDSLDCKSVVIFEPRQFGKQITAELVATMFKAIVNLRHGCNTMIYCPPARYVKESDVWHILAAAASRVGSIVNIIPIPRSPSGCLLLESVRGDLFPPYQEGCDEEHFYAPLDPQKRARIIASIKTKVTRYCPQLNGKLLGRMNYIAVSLMRCKHIALHHGFGMMNVFEQKYKIPVSLYQKQSEALVDIDIQEFSAEVKYGDAEFDADAEDLDSNFLEEKVKPERTRKKKLKKNQSLDKIDDDDLILKGSKRKTESGSDSESEDE